jgi:cyclohexanecarboxylate-CoA ligase
VHEVAVVVYTSGTEAQPKGVLHSEATLLYDAASMRRLLDLTADDVFFMPSPLAHITGLLNGVIGPVCVGATTVLQQRWDAAAALRLVADNRCTYSVLATPFLRQMFALPGADAALRSFRLVRCGGADIPADLVAEADALGVTVLRVYGLSEVPTLTCTLPTSSSAQRAATDGLPVDNVRMRLVDDAGRDVGAGEVGHILAAGPEMFLGYVDPALNVSAFTADGLLRTGDLGVVDAAGYLRIVGRAKDVIVRGGENLSAREIEDALRADPGIDDVAVVAVPDPVLGQRACAYVVPAAETSVDLARLRATVVDQGLAVQKTPEHLVLVDDLPRTASGKVRKDELRAMFRPSVR